jgi:hypothetical protein
MSGQTTQNQNIQNKSNLTASVDYIFNENSPESEELAALIKPLRKRFKYTIYYNALFLVVMFKYGQNVNTYMKKYFKNRMKGIFNLILFATLHSVGICTLLIGGNCLVLGINPITFIRKHKEITERIIEKEGLDVDSVSDVFRGPLQKIENSKLNGKTFQDTINKL